MHDSASRGHGDYEMSDINASLWYCYGCENEWTTGTEGIAEVIPKFCPQCQRTGSMVRIGGREGPEGSLIVLAEREDRDDG